MLKVRVVLSLQTVLYNLCIFFFVFFFSGVGMGGGVGGGGGGGANGLLIASAIN